MIEQLKIWLTGLGIFLVSIIGFIAAVVLFLYLKDKFMTDLVKNIAEYFWITLMSIFGLCMIYKIGYDFRNK
jgi:hypothetical protein